MTPKPSSAATRSRFEACTYDETYNDELLNAVPLEVQIQIRIREPARAPAGWLAAAINATRRLGQGGRMKAALVIVAKLDRRIS